MEIARRRAEDRERERRIDANPELWGLDDASLALPANEAVVIGADTAGRVTRVLRQDVFDVMRLRGSMSQAAHDAVRRLQHDVEVMHKTAHGRVDYSPRVDTSRGGDGFSDIRHRAGERIQSALSLAGPASARLLIAICEVDAGLRQQIDWRTLVKRETGESLADAQGAILRGACENLAGAYEMLEGGRHSPAFTHLARPG